MNLVLYSMKPFHGIIKISAIVIFAQIWYYEAQPIKGLYPFHGFVWYPPEPLEKPSIYEAVTRFRKSRISAIRILADVVFHENHKD